jgi:hypothetical protein
VRLLGGSDATDLFALFDGGQHHPLPFAYARVFGRPRTCRLELRFDIRSERAIPSTSDPASFAAQRGGSQGGRTPRAAASESTHSHRRSGSSIDQQLRCSYLVELLDDANRFPMCVRSAATWWLTMLHANSQQPTKISSP